MKKLFSLLIVTSLIAPSLVSAESGVSTREMLRLNATSSRLRTASSTKVVGFCAQIDKISVTIDTRNTALENKKDTNLQKRDDTRAQTRTDVDIKRDDNETKRKAQLEELSSRATTDVQKAAIAQFTSVMTKALEDRHAAVDAILSVHRKDVDTLAASRKTAIDAALVTLKASIETAKTNAKNACASGTSGDTVRTNLKNEIQQANQTFKTTVSTIGTVKVVAESTREARKKEIEAAEDTFKKSVEKAKVDLKIAMKASVTASTTIR